jgi:hypothetical protein
MKVIYLSNPEVHSIYEDLKEKGYHEWYITLKIIDEVQIDYSFLSKLTWDKLLNNDVITDTSGVKEKHYPISDHIKKEIQDIIHIMDVEKYDENIVTTTVKALYKHLIDTYEPIKKYKENSIVFRVDFFRDHTTDINGVKTYALRELVEKDDRDEDDGISKTCLYVATHADKHEDKRPNGYKTKFYDKKIGIAKEVSKRMNDLSNDKRHGGTQSPLYVKAIKAWIMPSSLCHTIEKELHDQLDFRNTGGEWFEDYFDDLISIVERNIKSKIKQGYPVVKIPITKDNEDLTFIGKLGKEFWEKNKEVTPTRNHIYKL